MRIQTDWFETKEQPNSDLMLKKQSHNQPKREQWSAMRENI